jgi:hypothetical protein
MKLIFLDAPEEDIDADGAARRRTRNCDFHGLRPPYLPQFQVAGEVGDYELSPTESWDHFELVFIRCVPPNTYDFRQFGAARVGVIDEWH